MATCGCPNTPDRIHDDSYGTRVSRRYSVTVDPQHLTDALISYFVNHCHALLEPAFYRLVCGRKQANQLQEGRQ